MKSLKISETRYGDFKIWNNRGFRVCAVLENNGSFFRGEVYEENKAYSYLFAAAPVMQEAIKETIEEMIKDGFSPEQKTLKILKDALKMSYGEQL